MATANSILLVTFAHGQLADGATVEERAMLIGMLPMALGLGEGGEQNAPLARAVIGGLSMATLSKLFFVPLTFIVIRNRMKAAA